MATHRSYHVQHWDANSARVLFHGGEYQDVRDELTGDTERRYVRTKAGRVEAFQFDGDCTYKLLCDFLDDKLNTEGSLTSIPGQVRKSAPTLRARA